MKWVGSLLTIDMYKYYKKKLRFFLDTDGPSLYRKSNSWPRKISSVIIKTKTILEGSGKCLKILVSKYTTN